MMSHKAIAGVDHGGGDALGLRGGKIEALEGLRGLAAIVVVFSHLNITFYNSGATGESGIGESILLRALGSLCNGAFSVWLFWVMSGFALTLKYHSESDERRAHQRLRDATLRRYPRLLLPVLASVLFVWLLQTMRWTTNDSLAKSLNLESGEWPGSFLRFEPSFWGALKGGVWQAFFIYDPSRSYNPVLWTMEKELYGSFFLFASLALFGKWRYRWIAYAFVVLVVYKLGIHWLNSFVLGAAASDFYIHSRDTFCSCLDLIPSSRRKLLGVVLAGMMAFLLLVAVGPVSSGSDLRYLLLATCLMVFVVLNSFAGSVLSIPPFVFLGKISFGVYLIHVPILFSAGFPIFRVCCSFFPEWYARAICSALILVLSLISGWVLWVIADRPAVFLTSRLKT